MKAQGTVKGILFEASDGAEYLLGFAGTRPVPTPILSRRQADGTFSLVEDVSEASKVATRQLGISGPHLIGPGTLGEVRHEIVGEFDGEIHGKVVVGIVFGMHGSLRAGRRA